MYEGALQRSSPPYARPSGRSAARSAAAIDALLDERPPIAVGFKGSRHPVTGQIRGA